MSDKIVFFNKIEIGRVGECCQLFIICTHCHAILEKEDYIDFRLIHFPSLTFAQNMYRNLFVIELIPSDQQDATMYQCVTMHWSGTQCIRECISKMKSQGCTTQDDIITIDPKCASSFVKDRALYYKNKGFSKLSITSMYQLKLEIIIKSYQIFTFINYTRIS